MFDSVQRVTAFVLVFPQTEDDLLQLPSLLGMEAVPPNQRTIRATTSEELFLHGVKGVPP
jgi:hypothetical protein